MLRPSIAATAPATHCRCSDRGRDHPRARHRAGAATPREALVRMAAATRLESAPGAVARYSDLGYILLGAALERAGGDRLDRLARDLIFEPLGMHASGFVDLTATAPAAR